jgi:hypothetical protein
LSGREGFGFLSLPPSLRGGIQRFLKNKTPIFHCARGEETEVNGGHRGDRTCLVSAQCLRTSRSCDRTRWRVRSRSTGRVRSRVEAYWKLTRWSAARLDQRVQSVIGPARPVVLRAWVVCAPARPVSLTSASDQRDCSRIKCLTASSCRERL